VAEGKKVYASPPCRALIDLCHAQDRPQHPRCCPRWAVEKLTPYKRNPRRNEDADEKTGLSAKEIGFRVPIIVGENGVIISGHTRLLAALHWEAVTRAAS
jgi:hypothetical protein